MKPTARRRKMTKSTLEIFSNLNKWRKRKVIRNIILHKQRIFYLSIYKIFSRSRWQWLMHVLRGLSLLVTGPTALAGAGRLGCEQIFWWLINHAIPNRIMHCYYHIKYLRRRVYHIDIWFHNLNCSVPDLEDQKIQALLVNKGVLSIGIRVESGYLNC